MRSSVEHSTAEMPNAVTHPLSLGNSRIGQAARYALLMTFLSSSAGAWSHAEDVPQAKHPLVIVSPDEQPTLPEKPEDLFVRTAWVNVKTRKLIVPGIKPSKLDFRQGVTPVCPYIGRYDDLSPECKKAVDEAIEKGPGNIINRKTRGEYAQATPEEFEQKKKFMAAKEILTGEPDAWKTLKGLSSAQD